MLYGLLSPPSFDVHFPVATARGRVEEGEGEAVVALTLLWEP